MDNTYKVYDLTLKVMETGLAYKEITSSKELVDFIQKSINPSQFPEERVYVIAFNAKGSPIGYTEHSRGSLSSSVVDLRKIFSFALLTNASVIAITHNHPSGAFDPSSDDIETTKRIAEGCKFLGLNFLDHIITTPFGGYYSFRERGTEPF